MSEQPTLTELVDEVWARLSDDLEWMTKGAATGAAFNALRAALPRHEAAVRLADAVDWLGVVSTDDHEALEAAWGGYRAALAAYREVTRG